MNSERMPVAAWTIKDILIVTFLVLFGGLGFYFFILSLFGDSRITFNLARYIGSILMIFSPLFWIRKKYGLSKETLGLRKGEFSLLKLVIIGLTTGIIYSLITEMTPLRFGAAPAELKNSYSYLNLILLPIDISGFATIVLAPISEEIMDRGFIYGYLRGKIGVVLGLFLQAILFSLLHLNYIYGDVFNLIISRFLSGLILGLLYEKTGSIYPSMVCHGVFNYLGIIFMVLHI